MSEPGTTKGSDYGAEAFGLLIREKRQTQGMTQLELADRIGVTKGAVSHWELGRVEGINPVHLHWLIQILKLSGEDLRLFRARPKLEFPELPLLPQSDMKVIHMYAALPESLRQHVRGIIEALSTSQGDRDEQEAAERGRGSYPEVTAATGQADGRIVCRNGHAKGSQGVSSQGGCGDGQGEENARTDAFEAKAKSQIASEILAANVQTLIDRVGSGSELARLTGVAQKTISRIANGENAVTLDTLNDLAKGARLQPWQLLSPGLNLSNPPLLFQRDAPSPARREA